MRTLLIEVIRAMRDVCLEYSETKSLDASDEELVATLADYCLTLDDAVRELDKIALIATLDRIAKLN